MSDLRAQQHDPTDFYDTGDTSALPIANIDSMPKSRPLDVQNAEFRLQQDDWSGRSADVLNNAYGPVVEAVQAQTGKPISSYVWIGHSSGGVNEAAVFRDLAAIRAKTPDFLKEIPDTIDAFHESVTQHTIARRNADQQTVDRAGGFRGDVAYAGGMLAGSIADPVNLMTMAVTGGPETTVARRILTQGVINAGTEAIEQPMVASERHKRGETLSAGEAATNVATAGFAGVAFQGLGELAVAGAKRLVSPASNLVADARTRIGWDRMTPAERGAANVVERDTEITATSPFTPGAGTEAHVAKLDAAATVLNNPEMAAAPTPATSAMPPAEVVKGHIRSAESGGDDQVGNPKSSAYGRYQFIDSTWRRYYRQVFGDTGETKRQILAKKADPAVQEQLIDRELGDGSRMLARIGVRETPGNLYLNHFLGQGGAEAVLRAAPETPIERLLTKSAIDANGFLRGKTAADVVEWASAKMGGDHGAPTLRRDLFASDEEFAAAQRAIDDEAAAKAQAEPQMVDAADRVDEALPARPGAIDPAIEPSTFDLMPAGEGVPSVRLYRAASQAERGQYTENISAARSASDVGDIVAIDIPREHLDTVAPQSADYAMTRSRTVDPAYADAIANPLPRDVPDAAPALAADTGDASIIGQGAIAQTGKPGYGIEAADDGSFATVVLRGKDGRPKAALMVPRDHDAATSLGGVASYVSPEIRQPGVATRMRNIAREAGLPVDEMERAAQGKAPEHVFGTPQPNQVAPAPDALKAFDDPYRGEGVRTQMQSLEHDVRMMVVADPRQLVRLDDEGAEQRLGDVVADLDADDAALQAARDCMQP